jgi:hypothetical protein
MDENSSPCVPQSSTLSFISHKMTLAEFGVKDLSFKGKLHVKEVKNSISCHEVVLVTPSNKQTSNPLYLLTRKSQWGHFVAFG